MKPIDIIIIILLAVLVALAIAFIARSKKKGHKCIGCPYSGQCPSQKISGNDCQKHNAEN